jgi:hypothetical protein
MSAVIADTHTIIWYLRSLKKLSTEAAIKVLILLRISK